MSQRRLLTNAGPDEMEIQPNGARILLQPGCSVVYVNDDIDGDRVKMTTDPKVTCDGLEAYGAMSGKKIRVLAVRNEADGKWYSISFLGERPALDPDGHWHPSEALLGLTDKQLLYIVREP